MAEYMMLDLFSGLGGASQAMQEADNWQVTTLDNQDRFNPDYCMDIMNVDAEHELLEQDFTLVWASPPCPRFSVAAIGHHWTPEHLPQTEDIPEHVAMVYKTLWIVQEIEPEYWFMENPRGKMRRITPMRPTGTIHYCQYGFHWQKPTDLWGNHPASFPYRKCSPGADCHQEAGRGFDSGTQASHIRDTAERSKVPRGVSEAVKQAVEEPGGKKQVKLSGIT